MKKKFIFRLVSASSLYLYPSIKSEIISALNQIILNYKYMEKDMKLKSKLLKAAFAITLTAQAFATSAHAEQKILVDLWDAGSDMTMSDQMRIKNHPDLSKAPMGIDIEHSVVDSGKITFIAINSSSDIEHEMVVARLKNPKSGLIYDDNSGGVNEDKKDMNIGEIPELKPGKTGALTLNLEAGTYVLYCNVPGHYASGMWTILTVRDANKLTAQAN